MSGKAYVAAVLILLAFGCVQNPPAQANNTANNSSAIPQNVLADYQNQSGVIVSMALCVKGNDSIYSITATGPPDTGGWVDYFHGDGTFMGRYTILGFVKPPPNYTPPEKVVEGYDCTKLQPPLHLICRGSICCQGFGDTCATFQCADGIYYKPGGMDAASLFINGSSGVIVARCGGNIAPINPGSCPQLEGTCDMTKPAANVPDAVNNPTNP